MIQALARRPAHAELSDDARFRRRVIRLTAVSAVALGLIAGLAATTLAAPGGVIAALVTGWVLMPAILLASLRRPMARYALVLPASLVSIGLLVIAVGWLPGAAPAATGWLLMAAGVWLGGGLGLWLWFRLLPVPMVLDDPFSIGRWALVGLHVALVIGGFVLASTALG